MVLTILGSGTSQGVPIIGCRCKVCTSSDVRDNRLRTSAMIEGDDFRFVIDAGPDFRAQMLRAGVRQIDSILLTHEHKDHIGGIDDVRALNFVDYPIVRRVSIYGTQRTLDVVRKDYDYAFASNKYRGVPEIELVEIDESKPFQVKGIEIIPIAGEHSPRFHTTGYRIANMAYLTDFSYISPEEILKLEGVDVLVVNALRFEAHPSHFNVEQALELIAKIAPKKAYLTHLSHEVGLMAEVEPQLPEGIYIAYDNLKIDI